MQTTPPNQIFKNLGNITAGWGAKTADENFHPAVDFANAKGTPVPSFTPGVVQSVDGGHQQGENNFGNSVTIKDAAGNQHQYHHLNNIGVKPGQTVGAGQPIGGMGNTGSTYSPSGQGDGTHLDYRIVSAYGQYVNPMTYLKHL